MIKTSSFKEIDGLFARILVDFNENSSRGAPKKTIHKNLMTNRDLVFVVQLKIMNAPPKGVLVNTIRYIVIFLAYSFYGIERITQKNVERSL